MGEFFRGWRRKFGVITLVMACVLMVGWVRGQTIEDVFWSGSGVGKSFHAFESSRNGIKWAKHSHNGVFKWLNGLRCESIETNEPHDPTKGFVNPQVIDWRWQFYGIDCGEFHDNKMSTNKVAWCLIPFQWIIIPLTVLSALLLLSKPRPRKPQSPHEHIPETAANHA